MNTALKAASDAMKTIIRRRVQPCLGRGGNAQGQNVMRLLTFSDAATAQPMARVLENRGT
jgi:hypothetical protein